MNLQIETIQLFANILIQIVLAIALYTGVEQQ